MQVWICSRTGWRLPLEAGARLELFDDAHRLVLEVDAGLLVDLLLHHLHTAQLVRRLAVDAPLAGLVRGFTLPPRVPEEPPRKPLARAGASEEDRKRRRAARRQAAPTKGRDMIRGWWAVAMLGLAGCAGATWNRPGAIQADLDQDAAECRLVAASIPTTRSSPTAYPQSVTSWSAAANAGQGLTDTLVGLLVQQRAHEDCLTAKGWARQ